MNKSTRQEIEKYFQIKDENPSILSPLNLIEDGRSGMCFSKLLTLPCLPDGCVVIERALGESIYPFKFKNKSERIQFSNGWSLGRFEFASRF